jgi:uncharacterized NAD(P)/FAD-binding protein YdhS
MIDLDVAIVGGGFSGCAVGLQLARRAAADLRLAIFEPGQLGRGAAYGTCHPEHLLNTRAHAMSLFPDEPDHFVRWLGSRGDADAFLSRRLYGDYVGENAGRAFQRAGFSVVPHRARRVYRGEGDRFVVESACGARFESRAVVLATGNPLPNDDFLPEEVLAHPGYIGDPWRRNYEGVGGEVLIVGSGLTALDVLVALDAQDHRGAVSMISRHGRFPETHARVAPYDVIPALDTRDARALLRSFRRHVAEARRRGFDRRSVVDAVRPESEATWRRLRIAEQHRFERHLRGLWDRHRHRAPEMVESVRRRFERSKRFSSYAGRLAKMEHGNATLVLRGGETVVIRPDFIVNCSGIGRAARMLDDPLLGAMLADGTITSQSQRYGLRVDQNLAAVGSTGVPTRGLWIVGPPARGAFFEAIAVPELRLMAELAATEILKAAEPKARWA